MSLLSRERQFLDFLVASATEHVCYYMLHVFGGQPTAPWLLITVMARRDHCVVNVYLMHRVRRLVPHRIKTNIARFVWDTPDQVEHVHAKLQYIKRFWETRLGKVQACQSGRYNRMVFTPGVAEYLGRIHVLRSAVWCLEAWKRKAMMRQRRRVTAMCLHRFGLPTLAVNAIIRHM